MAIRVVCDACFMEFAVKDALAGRKVKCKECGGIMRVPDSGPVEIEEFVEEAEPAPRKRVSAGRETRPKKGGNRASLRQIPSILIGLAVGGLVVIVVGIWLLSGSDTPEFAGSSRPAINSGLSDGPGPSFPPGMQGPGIQPPGFPSVAPATTAPGGDPSSLFPLASVPVPAFPELGPLRPIPGTDIQVTEVHLHLANAGMNSPGAWMSLRVYLPPGESVPRSRGCVLVAPAGTNLLSGHQLEDPTYHAETLPYAQAGFVTILYSLDGGVGESESMTNAVLLQGYQAFSASFAGIVNARNAFEFALAKLPQVDPERIFAAGHSSAAVVSLLFAEHEPRLKGCLSYAAASDVELRLAPALSNPRVETVLPGVVAFAKRSSPRTHMAQLNCAVFLFHAMDDSNEPFATSAKFAADLQQAGKRVTFEKVPRGDHYDSMIQAGIPKGIAWMKHLPGE